jgi:hypothetical protein
MWDIIQLDYSPNPSQPTLRQIIMALNSADKDILLFHCVDLDWRGEGYVFQFAPTVKVEEEGTINTLLPLLKHKYPDKDLESCFSHETVGRCEGLVFDVDKGTVVDSLVNDHLTFLDEENLLSFSSVITDKDNQQESDDIRPAAAAPFYNDSDSVSTLAKPGDTPFITPNGNNNLSFSRFENRSNDHTSVTSGTSTVNMETISTLLMYSKRASTVFSKCCLSWVSLWH